MHIIFCSDPLAPRAVDDAYADEAQAAMASGLEYQLISYEQLVHEQDAAAAVRRVPAATAPELALYRGWMLRPSEYQALYDALRARGMELINAPDAYRTCHYLPESYPLIRDATPATVWLPLDACGDLDTIMALLAPFGDQPVIVKDYVKSRKHEWFEACYIPSAADRQAVDRVVTRFLELQGDDISEGLVFRAYVAFQPIGVHPQSGMPLTREHRLFFLDGRLLADTPYWDAPIDETAELPIDHFRNVAARVPSRFFTMDVAQRIDGSWMIVELGDAQVAGLPERLDVAAFYAALSRAGRDAGATP
ncbi:MAG TPA: ATP-grasp domain-containing protein [Roseiflexaceae bacterium]|nr:ATP-grasp domain-containing protein [Roseiflexaceae bacterium]